MDEKVRPAACGTVIRKDEEEERCLPAPLNNVITVVRVNSKKIEKFTQSWGQLVLPACCVK